MENTQVRWEKSLQMVSSAFSSCAPVQQPWRNLLSPSTSLHGSHTCSLHRIPARKSSEATDQPSTGNVKALTSCTAESRGDKALNHSGKKPQSHHRAILYFDKLLSQLSNDTSPLSAAASSCSGNLFFLSLGIASHWLETVTAGKRILFKREFFSKEKKTQLKFTRAQPSHAW